MSGAAVGEEVVGLADLFAPQWRADPYPMYARVRATHPVWRPVEGLLVLSRHRDCAAVLRDPRFGHPDDAGLTRRRRRGAVAGSELDGGPPPVRSFLALNPPDHTRLRRLVSSAFSPRRVGALMPRVRELTAELLRAADGPATVDLIEALASPLPVGVICELLGVPETDRARLVAWSHALARTLDPAFLVSDDERRDQMSAREAFSDYLVELVAMRRRNRGDDLVSDLVAEHDAVGAESLSEAELVASCILLLIAGHETTTNLIGNGVLALLQNPDELGRLRETPELRHSAVEELFRYDSPVQVTTRTALTDGEAGGVSVPSGSSVLLLLASANRDPDAYTDPERLDVGRVPSPHLAFGQGIHFCLGAPLARLEVHEVLRALTEDVEHLELVGEPSWKDNAVLRGVARLDVRVTLGSHGGGGPRVLGCDGGS